MMIESIFSFLYFVSLIVQLRFSTNSGPKRMLCFVKNHSVLTDVRNQWSKDHGSIFRLQMICGLSTIFHKSRNWLFCLERMKKTGIHLLISSVWNTFWSRIGCFYSLEVVTLRSTVSLLCSFRVRWCFFSSEALFVWRAGLFSNTSWDLACILCIMHYACLLCMHTMHEYYALCTEALIFAVFMEQVWRCGL